MNSINSDSSKKLGEVLIEVKGLKKDFGKLEVLKGVDLNVRRGEVVVIIGPSGSGKSTFLRSLNLLEKPTAGTILVEGKDIMADRNQTRQLRERMGMVFQQFNLFPHLRVLDNITIAPMKVKKAPKQEIEAKALQLLDRVGLKDKADAWPSQLSGGQKQRVAIVRALAMDPDMMLFDEPTSALDPQMVGEVLDVMRRLAEEGLTMIVVTHEMAFARDVSSDVVYMSDGIICEQGKPYELFENPQNPKTREFLSRFLAR